MNKKSTITYGLNSAFVMACLFSSTTLASISITDSNAEVVYVQNDCTNVINCSTTFKEIINWTWDVRQPTEATPLIINIGPGLHPLSGKGSREKLCDGGGHVTFRGSGPGITLIDGKGPGVGLSFGVGTVYSTAMLIEDCDNLVFENLTIKSGTSATFPSENGVTWVGGGSSVWTNVHVESSGYGWIDVCNGNGELGEHKWFSSSIQSSGGYYNVAYASMCGNNSFYGGEIIALKDPNLQVAGTLVGAAAVGPNGNIAIYGSLVRALNPAGGAGFGVYDPNSIFSSHGGLLAKDQGTIHMHGGIISVKSETTNNSSVYGAVVQSGGSAHTPDTAFGLSSGGTGIMSRIINHGGTANSPFNWPEGVTLPDVVTASGADTFVETDCASNGDCDSGTGTLHPHIMVYDAACSTAGTWFDVNRNKCRGEP